MKSLILVFLLAATLVHCENGAMGTHQAFGVPSKECLLLADPGPCKALIPKWYYNRKTKQCEEFNYGGCGGNANRFDTKEECEDKCAVDICRLKPDPGPCEAATARWFYNPSSGECEQFIYGGCEGNANNFQTRRECQEACRDDCEFLPCTVDPCDVAECPAYPDAVCVANICTGCDVDFLVEGRLVDCGEGTPECLSAGKECKNPKAPMRNDAEGSADLTPCCDGLVCCACEPKVLPKNFVPPPLGTCSEVCACSID